MDVVTDARRDLGGIADIKERSANELAAVRRRSL
ncbi:MAG: hypothetical protein QOE15_1372, partial [Acidimicrobiaceae bacterium]|nr:hypothetical protein [Acidimicrobiaceae bacterium]